MKIFLFTALLVFTLFTGAGAEDSALRDALITYLSAASPWPGAVVAIDNVEVIGADFPGRGKGVFKISPRNKARSTGRVSFNVSLMREGRSVTAAVVRADVEFLKKVVVAARPIRMREVIASDDVRLSSMDVSAIPVTAAYSLDDVVGKSAKRPLSAGRVVREDYLQRTRMIKRGQLIDVRVKSGVIMVRSRATATSDGFLGGVIKARAAGGREISGEVSGPGEMVINLR